jgi:1-acyl-sn-glycerol-3-phosphate acyltransferase
VKIKILYYSGWLLTRLITRLVFRIRVNGQENFPDEGGFILATNHISYYDPLLAGSWTSRQVYFFAKQELFKNKLFGTLIRRTNALPVRRGTIDRHALALSVDVIKQGYGLTIFPEGTRSKKDGFLEPKAGVGMIALRAGCPIVVAYLHGSNRLMDCFMGRDRLSVTFGKTINPERFASLTQEKESYKTVARMVMAEIEKIKERVQALK